MKDEERTLNHHGKHDAPLWGSYLRDESDPDLIVTSPAVRALTTAKIFAEELLSAKKIEVDRSIYRPTRQNCSTI